MNSGKAQIGLSLNAECFLDNNEAHFADLKQGELIAFCKDVGLTRIEIKYGPRIAKEDVLRVFDLLVKEGFSVAVHDFLNLDVVSYELILNEQHIEISFDDIFPALGDIPREYPLVITVHPIDKNKFVDEPLLANKALIGHISHLIESNSYNYRLALEIQRKSSNHEFGTRYEHILGAISEGKPDIIGICWDFGHSYDNVLANVIPPEPPIEFLSHTINTHIHSLQGTTHLPLTVGDIPLKNWLKLLANANYNDAYILEISHQRTQPFISDNERFLEAVAESVNILRACM